VAESLGEEKRDFAIASAVSADFDADGVEALGGIEIHAVDRGIVAVEVADEDIAVRMIVLVGVDLRLTTGDRVVRGVLDG
jgi:hypothetical protein